MLGLINFYWHFFKWLIYIILGVVVLAAGFFAYLAGHSDFTDFSVNKQASPLRYLQPLIKSVGRLSLLGPFNGFRATEIVNAYLVNFFDKYLKGKPSQLLDGGENRYPEVERMGLEK